MPSVTCCSLSLPKIAVERPDPQITPKQMTDNQRHVRRLAETPGFRACDTPALLPAPPNGCLDFALADDDRNQASSWNRRASAGWFVLIPS